MTSFDSSGHFLVVSSGQMVIVYDVVNPAAPRAVRSYNTPGYARSTRLTGGTLYVADGTAGLVILAIPDVDAPQISITSPAGAGPIVSTTAVSSLSGTASDVGGLASGTVAKVIWANDRGGGGVATGTSSWSIPSLVLGVGRNVITVTGLDDSGNAGTATIQLDFLPPDTVPPVVNIDSPSWLAHGTTLAAVNLSGTAGDNVGVTTVSWSNARGGSGTATGTNAWTISRIDLQPGPNPITVTAVDAAGNSGSSNVNLSYHAPDTVPPVVKIQFPTLAAKFSSAVATVNLSGTASDDSGAVGAVVWKSDQGGQGTCTGTGVWSINAIPLKPGPNGITITALDPSGNQSTDFIVVTYTPPPALDLSPLAGAYYGLTQAGDLNALPNGYASITMSRNGVFSGRVGFGSAVYALRGKIAADGTFTKTILRQGLPPLVVTLALGTADGKTITGMITDGVTSVTILADKATSGTVRSPAAQKGYYTFLLNPNSTDVAVPPGIGYGRVTVTPAGLAQMIVALPDASVVSQAAPLSAAGVLQVFIRLQGRGQISGPVVFRSLDATDFDGALSWSMPPNSHAPRYSSGYDASVSLEGSAWIAPSRGGQIFPAGPASLAIIGGGITVAPATKSLNVDTGNRINILSIEKFSMTLNGPFGLFLGTFQDASHAQYPFHGALIQKQVLGGGVFLGKKAAGSVLLESQAP